jgi:hypothetical protein
MLKNDYAVNVCVFPSLFCKIRNWTLFLSIFQFPKKVLEKKYAKLYNKWPNLLKGNKSPHLYFLHLFTFQLQVTSHYSITIGATIGLRLASPFTPTHWPHPSTQHPSTPYLEAYWLPLDYTPFTVSRFATHFLISTPISPLAVEIDDWTTRPIV